MQRSIEPLFFGFETRRQVVKREGLAAFMPYQRMAQAVLAQWREVERRIGGLPPGSAEGDELKLESYRLRQEYQLLIDQAVVYHRPEPPPFPGLAEDDEPF